MRPLPNKLLANPGEGTTIPPKGAAAALRSSCLSNIETAKALGLDVPSLLQQRADDVIE